jgi:hypothetical protein
MAESAQTSLRDVGDRAETHEPPDAVAIRTQQALVIGIATYGPGLGQLDNATEDASSVADLLERDFGFALLPAGRALLDEQADRASIRSVVKSSLSTADASTRWLFYFAGHGFVADGQGYLLPADARSGDHATFFPLQELLDWCLSSACGEALIILDTCFSGQALVGSDQLSDYIPAQAHTDRVRQVLTSGNPDQRVLDAGGSGHSVFAQVLLEALGGWAGVHEPDGSLRFSRLLDYLASEVPRRLPTSVEGAVRQQPIGGNLVGNRLRRDFMFQCISPRLPPEMVRGTRSEDAARRCQELVRLVGVCQEAPAKKPLAATLATMHLCRTPGTGSATLLTPMLLYEPDSNVRAEAARTLGALGDPKVADALIAALGDEPHVCRNAAQALGQLSVVRAATPLLDHLRAADDALLLDLTDAIGALGQPEPIVDALRVALSRGRLVPFVGPDLAPDLTGLPERAVVARQLAKDAGLQPSNSLAETAAGSMHGGRSRYGFTETVVQMLGSPARPGKIHQALVTLRAPIWISGAYDGLLAKALEAQQIISGGDTKYLRPGIPTVVRLMGDSSTGMSLVVLPEDYEVLREGEDDRESLLTYLRTNLQDKIVLFLGYDPQNPDFDLFLQHILNKHLADVNVRGFFVWPSPGSAFCWGTHEIRPILHEPLDFIRAIGCPSSS